MSDKIKKLIVCLLIIVFAVITDQASKQWAENNLASLRYPDHQIEVSVTAENADSTLEQFVKKNYDSLNNEESLRVISSATKDGQKVLSQDKLNEGDTIAFNHMSKTVIEGYYDYQYARNPGAAWSFLADQSANFRKYFFGITGIIAVIAMGVFIGVSNWRKQKFMIITLASILGGALGNIIDRFRLSYVIDFISWHVAGHYWPTFNIADVFVTVGVALLIIDLIIHGKSNDDAKTGEDAKLANAKQDCGIVPANEVEAGRTCGRMTNCESNDSANAEKSADETNQEVADAEKTADDEKSKVADA